MKEDMASGAIASGTTTASIPDPRDTAQGPMGPILKHYRVLDNRYKKNSKKQRLLKKFKEIRQ